MKPKEVFQKIFLGFGVGDLVYFIDENHKERVRVIKIFGEGLFSNMVLVKSQNGNRKSFIIGIGLLRP